MSTMSDTLPSMEDFVRNHLDEEVYFDEINHQTCGVCQDELVSNDREGDAEMVVRLPSCGHLFHKQCILNTLDSILNNRNQCPLCRTALCELNLLSPDKEAARAADEHQHHTALVDFDTEVYAFLIAVTDDYFSRQQGHYFRQGREDYIRVISEVRQWWTRSGHSEVRVCHDHVRMGWDWFEYEVARRVETLLLNANATTSWSGRLFASYIEGIRRNLDHFWPLPTPRAPSEASDDTERSDTEEDNFSIYGDQLDDVPTVQPTQGEDAMSDMDAKSTAQPLNDDEEYEPVSIYDLQVPLTPPYMPTAQASTQTEAFTLPAQGFPLHGGGAPTHSVPLPLFAPAPIHESQDHSSMEDDEFGGSTLGASRPSSRATSRSDPSSVPSRRHRHRRDRTEDAHRDRELRHYRRSHFSKNRKWIEKHYDIVSEMNNVGPVDNLGGMSYRVKNRAGREISIVRGAVGYTYLGESVVFYRLKD